MFAKLTFIALDGNGLHLASPIIEILRKSKNLVELNISDNNIGYHVIYVSIFRL